jgi:hypothetical protein
MGLSHVPVDPAMLIATDESAACAWHHEFNDVIH